jgi:hypothetical protein
LPPDVPEYFAHAAEMTECYRHRRKVPFACGLVDIIPAERKKKNACTQCSEYVRDALDAIVWQVLRFLPKNTAKGSIYFDMLQLLTVPQIKGT